MKRRDFLKKAGLAIVAAPVLATAATQPPEAATQPPEAAYTDFRILVPNEYKLVSIPNDPYFYPGKYLFDDPRVIAQCQEQERKSGPARVFTDTNKQTKFLKRHFAEYTDWQRIEYRDWKDFPAHSSEWSQSSKIIVWQRSAFPKETHINFHGWNMYVELGAEITPKGNELRILHKSLHGDELDWRWRPAQCKR